MSVQSTELPEPGGVVGRERYDDLLVSLDDGCLPMVDAIGATASRMYRTTLGRTHPLGQETFELMTHPQPGGLVVVRDSIGHRDPDTRRRGLGYLIEVRREYATTRSVWERERREASYLTDDDRLVEPEAWYIQYGPSPTDVCRWTNCTVLTLPWPGDGWHN